MSPHQILVIDSDPAVHQLLASVLPPGWQLESAYGGVDGLARIQASPYHLLIADLCLPGLDDPDLLPRLQELRPGMRVLVLTAGAGPIAVIRAIRGRVLSYFTKPFPTSTVVELITQTMDTPAWPDDILVDSGHPEWVTLRARCHSRTGDRLVQFVRELLVDLPPAHCDDTVAAFRELLLNAIEHGCRFDPGQWVRVSILRAARALICHIQDPGNGFSFRNLPHAAVSNPPDAPVQHLELRLEQGLRPGGFGILLTRHLVDDLLYNEAGNEVVFVKYL